MVVTSERRPWQVDGWEMVIGLEIHAQISSHAKLFSSASTAFGHAPNSQVSMIDAAMPGMLPVANAFCIEQAVRAGLGLNAQINLYSRFDRKNYFYPDLPQGYQISQFYHPIVGEGSVEVETDQGGTVTVGIERAHLEQDAGKSLHDLDPDRSYVDLNRCGVALIEIVSRPDMRSPDEAAAYMRTVRAILVALGVCGGDMEKGQMRADVNVSVRPAGSDDLGTRCEIKNVNSFRFVRDASDFEARRQIALLQDGGSIRQETRLFDPQSGHTRTMRSKEDAHDYRYFPDPDLPPLRLSSSWVAALEASLPELPVQKRDRFVEEYGLSAYDARVLAADPGRADFFETVAKGRNARLAANWVSQEVFGYLNREGLDIEASPVDAQRLGALLDLIAANAISGRIAKNLFARMIADPHLDPGRTVESEGLAQMSDPEAIEKLVDALVAEHQKAVAQVREQRAAGHARPKALGWLVGQVMAASKGKANPKLASEILIRRLGL